MENLKSLADQLREEMAKPGAKKAAKATGKVAVPKKSKIAQPEVVEAIRAFDNSEHKTMIHIRFDTQTADLMNRFKLATGIDVTKLVAYSVHSLFQSHPELKQTIKNYLQNLDL
jgi:isocitrate lyase